ncbi:MAG: Asp23/Gls24 family envelope stress response protein [Clostridia bacterium]|nr:Asp23/Gls24 family envelope stress response protein [Clostridia bacterium]
METKDNMDQVTHTDIGVIKIADEVVAIVASLAATEVKGVAGMSGGVSAGIVEMLGRKNLSKGVKVEVGEKEAAVDVFVIVEFGASIPDVAQQIQKRVKEAIETMTGLKVVEINIHVQGVAFEKPESKDVESQRVK